LLDSLFECGKGKGLSGGGTRETRSGSKRANTNASTTAGKKEKKKKGECLLLWLVERRTLSTRNNEIIMFCG